MNKWILLSIGVLITQLGFCRKHYDHNERMKPYLPEHFTILDCGASVGHSSLSLLKRYPGAQVYAVEADPSLYQKLLNNTKNQPNIKAFHYALGDRDGVSSFYPNKPGRHHDQGSVYPQSKKHWFWKSIQLESTPIEVPMKTLSTFCAENNISHFDYLYLDMQGAEYPMLKASPEIMEKAKVIFTEVSFMKIYKGITLYNEVRSFLIKHGFKPLAVYKKHRSWAMRFSSTSGLFQK